MTLGHGAKGTPSPSPIIAVSWHKFQLDSASVGVDPEACGPQGCAPTSIDNQISLTIGPWNRSFEGSLVSCSVHRFDSAARLYNRAPGSFGFTSTIWPQEASVSPLQ